MKQILSNDIINQYLPTLIHCPLFNKLGEPELRGYLHNAKVIVHSYKKNDFIALAGDPMEGIGVILEGSALLTRENVMGQRVIMANLDQSWIGVDVTEAFSEACGRPVVVVNDADAAGLAEVQFGAAKGQDGLVIATTLGTGIGTALIYNGALIPNTELGHIMLSPKHLDAEKYASSAVRENEELGYKKWAKRLTKYYGLMEKYFNPDLFTVGGGVSRQSDKFLPYVDIKTPIVPATLRNQAGIVGAAYYASTKQQ